MPSTSAKLSEARACLAAERRCTACACARMHKRVCEGREAVCSAHRRACRRSGWRWRGAGSAPPPAARAKGGEGANRGARAHASFWWERWAGTVWNTRRRDGSSCRHDARGVGELLPVATLNGWSKRCGKLVAACRTTSRSRQDARS
eukprot:5578281-Pleurochrysis_carterae.AAC.1